MAETEMAEPAAPRGDVVRAAVAMDDDPRMRGEGPSHEPGGHVAPIGLYLLVYAALIALTATTVGVAFVNLGPFSNVAAVGIAVAKATLVVLFFMHVRWSPRLIPLVAVAGFFWLIHLMGGTLSDYFTRGLLGVPGR